MTKRRNESEVPFAYDGSDRVGCVGSSNFTRRVRADRRQVRTCGAPHARPQASLVRKASPRCQMFLGRHHRHHTGHTLWLLINMYPDRAVPVAVDRGCSADLCNDGRARVWRQGQAPRNRLPCPVQSSQSSAPARLRALPPAWRGRMRPRPRAFSSAAPVLCMPRSLLQT